MKKKLMMSAMTLAAFAAALFSQDIAGTWQGTLTPPQGKGKTLRMVMKIAKNDKGKLAGTMFSIDQGGQPLPISEVTLQNGNVKMSMPGIGGTFEGKMANPDTIEGSWSQGGPNSIPLTLVRATPETAWAIPEPPKPPTPMAANFDPEFEVATIKPSEPNRPGKAFTVQGRRFITINTSLTDLITFAYGIHARQVTDGPSWMENDLYDITAQPNGEGQPSQNQWRTMIRKLLQDRFKFEFHRDKKELSVYAITVAAGGPKLTKSEGDPNGLPSLFFRGLGNLPARNATMGEFAGVMQSAVLDRPVIDQTGITGRYDFVLSWTPDEFQFGGAAAQAKGKQPAGDPPPDLFTAMREQLGLRLESTKAPAEVFVVDKAEKPSEN